MKIYLYKAATNRHALVTLMMSYCSAKKICLEWETVSLLHRFGFRVCLYSEGAIYIHLYCDFGLTHTMPVSGMESSK